MSNIKPKKILSLICPVCGAGMESAFDRVEVYSDTSNEHYICPECDADIGIESSCVPKSISVNCKTLWDETNG